MITQNFVTLPRTQLDNWFLLLTKGDVLSEVKVMEELRAALTEQVQPLEFNGLTKEETDASMSVRGLSKKVQPAQGEPAKLWCETCEGSGQVYEESQAGIPGSGGNRKCPDCSGDGYTTSTVYRTVLLQSNAERVPLTRNKKQAMWVAATIDLPSQENCYLRGIVDAENAHNITKGQQ